MAENWELKGFHHFYLGILLLLAGFVLVFSHPVWGGIIAFAGLVILLDDLWQHFWQALGDDLTYKSPLHRLYGYLYRYRFIKWLNKIADKLFGG